MKLGRSTFYVNTTVIRTYLINVYVDVAGNLTYTEEEKDVDMKRSQLLETNAFHEVIIVIIPPSY